MEAAASQDGLQPRESRGLEVTDLLHERRQLFVPAGCDEALVVQDEKVGTRLLGGQPVLDHGLLELVGYAHPCRARRPRTIRWMRLMWRLIRTAEVSRHQRCQCCS